MTQCWCSDHRGHNCFAGLLSAKEPRVAEDPGIEHGRCCFPGAIRVKFLQAQRNEDARIC
jgi:hypothetical protein